MEKHTVLAFGLGFDVLFKVIIEFDIVKGLQTFKIVTDFKRGLLFDDSRIADDKKSFHRFAR